MSILGNPIKAPASAGAFYYALPRYENMAWKAKGIKQLQI